MEGAGSETLPALKIPSRDSGPPTPHRARQVVSMSLPATPDSMRLPQVSNNRLTNVTYRKGGNRLRGYGAQTLAYGTTEVVKQLYTGQLKATYFNDICYGRRATPREFQYRTPTKDREKELWEPKHVSREQTRHKIRDIQDARFRKQSQLELQSVKKERVRFRKMETALLKQSETPTHGLTAYFVTLDKQKERYAANCKKRKASLVNPAC